MADEAVREAFVPRRAVTHELTQDGIREAPDQVVTADAEQVVAPVPQPEPEPQPSARRAPRAPEARSPERSPEPSADAATEKGE